ncbi:MAG: hypothetical protein LBQ86_04650, partial [Holophagales bacterium]|nr:hypothetical protein [Holophagales bacterium]
MSKLQNLDVQCSKGVLQLPHEVIAKPPGNIARQYAILEKCGYGVRVSGNAGGFAIIVIQLEKRLAVFKIRLRFPFLSPPVGGSLHSQRSLRAPR